MEANSQGNTTLKNQYLSGRKFGCPADSRTFLYITDTSTGQKFKYDWCN